MREGLTIGGEAKNWKTYQGKGAGFHLINKSKIFAKCYYINHFSPGA